MSLLDRSVNLSLLADFIGLIHWCTMNALAYTGGFSHIIVILMKTCVARARLLVGRKEK